MLGFASPFFGGCHSYEESRAADIHTEVDWLVEGYLLSVEKETSQQLIGLLPLRQLNYYPISSRT
jgi:hypothetical protein